MRSSAGSASAPLLDEQQLAWCAGVIDCLGLIKTRAMKTGSELGYVAVSTTKMAVLHRLAELTGVKAITVHRDYKRLGCNQHCDEAHLHVHSTTARWSLTGARAAVFLAAIEPYLVVKTSEASDAVSAGLLAPRKPATLGKMYALGWPELEAS